MFINETTCQPCKGNLREAGFTGRALTEPSSKQGATEPSRGNPEKRSSAKRHRIMRRKSAGSNVVANPVADARPLLASHCQSARPRGPRGAETPHLKVPIPTFLRNHSNRPAAEEHAHWSSSQQPLSRCASFTGIGLAPTTHTATQLRIASSRSGSVSRKRRWDARGHHLHGGRDEAFGLG